MNVMNAISARVNTVEEPWTTEGNLAAEVRETHTGVVVLLGDKAYKAKKSVTTDFLDFSTTELRKRACEHEVALNRRLAPDSYLGVAHFSDPQGWRRRTGDCDARLRRLNTFDNADQKRSAGVRALIRHRRNLGALPTVRQRAARRSMRMAPSAPFPGGGSKT
jgi:hypothetical protein